VVAAYERLRRSVLGEASDAEGEGGLALLLRRGVRGWLETRHDRAPERPSAHVQTDSTLGNDLRGELTRLVATMALGATGKEART
jgi:hypothetical protein